MIVACFSQRFSQWPKYNSKVALRCRRSVSGAIRLMGRDGGSGGRGEGGPKFQFIPKSIRRGRGAPKMISIIRCHSPWICQPPRPPPIPVQAPVLEMPDDLPLAIVPSASSRVETLRDDTIVGFDFDTGFEALVDCVTSESDSDLNLSIFKTYTYGPIGSHANEGKIEFVKEAFYATKWDLLQNPDSGSEVGNA
jgi:hypothetical protein